MSFPPIMWRRQLAPLTTVLSATNVFPKIISHLANSLIEMRRNPRFLAQAKPMRLFAVAARVGISPAPLTSPFVSNSKVQRRRPEEVSFIFLALIALITALIAISLAIRTATARITNRYPKVTTTRRTRNHQNFSKHLNPSLATAATLAIALTITALSCGTPRPTTQTSSTPPGTYILTLTATAPPTSSPPTLSLTLTVQQPQSEQRNIH